MNLKSFLNMLVNMGDIFIRLVDLWGKEVYSGMLSRIPRMYLANAKVKDITLPDNSNDFTLTIWGLHDAGIEYSTNVDGKYVKAEDCLEIGKELYDAYGPDVDPYDLDEEDAECYLAYKRSLEFSSFVSGRYIRASRYDLVNQDGDAFALIGYTSRALESEGLGDLVPKMKSEAMSGDYDNLVRVCDEYIQMANDAVDVESYVPFDDQYEDDMLFDEEDGYIDLGDDEDI